MRLYSIIIVLLFAFYGIAYSDAGEVVYCLSTSIDTKDGQRVTQIKISVNSGGIRQLRELPPGWYISINNDPSWNTILIGNIIVGSAATDLKRLVDMVCVSKLEKTGIPFEVSIEYAFTKDFDHEEVYHLRSEEFTLIEQR